MRETFLLKDSEVLLANNDEENQEKIVVVSVIGKSAFNSLGLKVKPLGRMFNSNNLRTNESTIEGYHDEENRIVYLHVHSLLDTDNFVKHYEEIAKQNAENDSGQDFLSIYDEVKTSFSKAMFTLFFVSHIVILSHPLHTFDMNYFNYFKAISGKAQKMQQEISKVLWKLKCIGDEWINAGRPATPRLIFYFEKCPKNVVNIKKYEHNIEDRIYHVLRKSTIIINHRSWNLFAIPLNEEFVFVSTAGTPDRLGQAVRGLLQGCQSGGPVQIQVPYCSQSNDPRNFQTFLQQHIKAARSKGFDEVRSHFELPTLKQWALAAKAIQELIFKLKTNDLSELATETLFSERRCLKVVPIALARYMDGVTGRYTTAAHETRLGYALDLFAAQARGPKFAVFSQQLVQNCEDYWKNGRQLCEAPSLTGNPCTLRNGHPENQDHSSGVKYVAVCDCGRKQGSRDDPYNAKDANFTFYHNLSKECGCSKSERITFPVAKETDSSETAASPRVEGMLTTASPAGLLPEFSSWSLVCLGPSSLYSHNLGLSENYHPGFCATTNYLLPWDVLVYVKTPQPNASEEATETVKVPRKRDAKGAKWVPQFNVKLFIGIEYECPKGHRFMLAAPDKILKAAPGSIVKDKGQKVAESDMPLYYPCLCGRVNKMVAQLMRLHVVTPKAAVHVKVNPRVQPAAGAPIFVPNLDGPSTLTQAAYWILRMPYIYSANNINYTENQTGRLLSGVFTVKKIDHN